jgi:hypothetical protein
MTAAAVQRALDSSAPAGSRVDRSEVVTIGDRLMEALPSLVERLPAGQQVVMTLPLLRRARSCPERLAQPEEPFTWRPAFVRRSLGLAVVDACVTGRFRTPAEAVGPVADEAVADWERTGWRTYHWEPWVAGLDPGARAVVLADALTWATALWSSFEWGSFGLSPRLGGPDDQWICPATRTMRLKARAELRVPLVDGGSRPGRRGHTGPASALVSVSSGCPGTGWDDELAYLALVAGLRSPTRPVPARVLGLWPDAGLHSSVEIDHRALGMAADRVVAAVAAVVEARLSSAAHD